MSTVSDQVPAVNGRKPRRKPERLVRLLARLGLIVLTIDKVPTSYALAIGWAAEGAAFRLQKLTAEGKCGDNEPYDVLITSTRASCECKGFLRWNHCKHIDALRALQFAKRLPTKTQGCDK